MTNMPASTLERIRRYMVGLRMPRALEALDATLARFEQGDSSMLEVLETLLGEEDAVISDYWASFNRTAEIHQTSCALAGESHSCNVRRINVS